MILGEFFSKIRLFLLSVFIIFASFYQSSFSLNLELLDTEQYALSFYSTNKDVREGYKAIVKVKMKDGWQLFAKQKNDEELLPNITLKTSSYVKDIDVDWPDPTFDESKDAYVYNGEVLIPIHVDLEDNANYPTDFNFNVFIAYCKDVCITKSHDFRVSLPRVDHDDESYKLIKLHDVGLYSVVGNSFIIILLVSFLGGFILNFMPCVLPVISLKVLSIIKARSDVTTSRYHFIAISLGIVTCFIIIGIIISTFKLAGQHIGLGFNFQYPIFVVTLILLIILFSSIINDSIHVDIPSKWKEFLIEHSKESRLIGSYLSGVFATILATPCTAPFLGAAIGIAMVLSITKMLLSFMSMGIGMALPFVILSFFPGAIKFIPTPGPWIAKFKKFLEILLYLTALWLIWVISVQLGTYPAIALFLSCLLFKFLLEKRENISSYTKTILIFLVLATAYAVPIRTSVLEAKYEEKIDQIWRPFTISKMQRFIKGDKVVVVDITAEWCMTCKYNKIAVLENPFIIRFLEENEVVALRGDYTNRDQRITDFLESYSRYGIPFTLVFSKKYPKGIILPTILKTSDLINAVKKAKIEVKDWSDGE